MSGYQAIATYLEATTGVDCKVSFNLLKEGYRQGRRHRNFERLISHFKIPISVDHLISVYRTHEPTISLPFDSLRALQRTQNRYHLGMITDGHVRTQYLKLRALRVCHYFDKIIVNDLTLGRSKNQPDSFLQILQYFSVRPAEAAYVGDNPAKDFRWPKRLGMRSICVQRQDSLYRTHDPTISNDSSIAKIRSLDALWVALERP